MSTRARWAPTALDLGSVGAGGRCWRRVLRVDARALSNSLVQGLVWKLSRCCCALEWLECSHTRGRRRSGRLHAVIVTPLRGLHRVVPAAGGRNCAAALVHLERDVHVHFRIRRPPTRYSTVMALGAPRICVLYDCSGR